MNPTWQRVKHILADALDLEPNRRAAFLEQECTEQPELRSELDELLSDSESVDWLSTPPMTETNVACETSGLPVGFRLGPYEILRELARGGAGVVYLARREDHFRKLVAVKILAPQFGAGELVRRFHVERQILATLEHPSIAHLLDGGVAPTGEPYLVIEYVEGVPIDEYCEANGLSVRRRLELFRRVCEAVDYAHRRLIVHRDLKPANILITGEGQPKLLDFGIAKLLDPGAITRSAFELTQYGLHPMTPEYASPEQASGDRVTTASDVYSLGVLLYRLLAGRLPYEVRGESLPVMIRSICEREPARLRELPRDLEAVVFRALEKEPERRYSSAAALSDDLGSWLEGRPVKAAQATALYRARKFIRRHTASVVVGILAFTLLCAGLGFALHQRRIAIEQRDRAESLRVQSERRLEENQRLARTFLFEAAGKLAAVSPDRETRRSILRQAATMLDRLAVEAGATTAQVELAESFLYLSTLQSDPTGPGPADPVDAQNNALRAQRILAPLSAQAPKETRILKLLASCYLRLADAYFFAGQYHGALASYQEAWRRYKRLFGSLSAAEREQLIAVQSPASHITPERIRRLPRLNQGYSRERMTALWRLGEVFTDSGFHDYATAIYLATFDTHARLATQYPDDIYIQTTYGHLLQSLGGQHAHRRDVTRARELYAQAAVVFRRLPVRDAAYEQFRQVRLAELAGKVKDLDSAQ